MVLPVSFVRIITINQLLLHQIVIIFIALSATRQFKEDFEKHFFKCWKEFGFPAIIEHARKNTFSEVNKLRDKRKYW